MTDNLFRSFVFLCIFLFDLLLLHFCLYFQDLSLVDNILGSFEQLIPRILSSTPGLDHLHPPGGVQLGEDQPVGFQRLRLLLLQLVQVKDLPTKASTARLPVKCGYQALSVIIRRMLLNKFGRHFVTFGKILTGRSLSPLLQTPSLSP